MSVWNPWRGCKRYSEGCKHCYIHKGDAKRGVDTSVIALTDKFDAPIATKKNGEYKIKSGTLVYLCFSTDFFIEEADCWRADCWKMIKQRSDLTFLFLTKRILRFYDCIPDDWGNGYDNVIIGVSVENQAAASSRLSFFDTLPIKHKNIILQPMLEQMNIEQYLSTVELVVIGGESDKFARPLKYDWVLDIRNQCEKNQTNFTFRQCGSHFIKDGIEYKLQVKDLCAQARKANINLHFDK